MKKVFSVIFLFMFIFTNISYGDNAHIGYDNTKVKTTTPEGVYNANGNKIYKDGKLICDFSTITTVREGIYDSDPLIIKRYDEKQAKTFFITDLSYNYNFNHQLVIYAIGLSFKPRNVNFNDTSEYYNMKVKVGTPYYTAFSYNTVTQEYDALICDPGLAIWDMPYVSYYDESKVHLQDDSLYDGREKLINFIDNIIFPRIVASKNNPDLTYMIVGERGKYEDLPKINNKIRVYRFSTQDNRNNLPNKFYDISYQDILNIGKNHGKHFIDLHNFYIKEDQLDKVVAMSLGDSNSTISIAVSVKFDPFNDVASIDEYWRDRNEVLKDANQ